MQFNLNDVYQIESGASHKKIYRFKNQNQGKIIIDFSYDHNDYLSFLEVNNFLSMINISVPKIFETYDTKNIIIMEDFGDIRYDKLINRIDPKEILIDAINSLIEIQNSLNLSMDDIKTLIINSFKSSFLSKDEKRKWISTI